jgi:hypothetical protein
MSPYRNTPPILFALLVLLASVSAAFGQSSTPEAPAAAALPRIAYIAAASVAEDASSPRSLARLETVLAFDHHESWEAFVETDRAVDALIIDASTLDDVDAEAVAAAYQQGTVIAGFDIPIEAFAELVGDPSLTADDFAAEPYPGSGFIIASRLTLCAAAATTTADETGSLCSERLPANPRGYMAGAASRATSSLDTAADVRIFATVLVQHIESMAEARAHFAETAGLMDGAGEGE